MRMSAPSGEIYRQKQSDFINKGQWNKAIEMDILDLHSKFGNKYDVSVHQMLDYAYNEGLITKRQRNKLKKIKCK